MNNYHVPKINPEEPLSVDFTMALDGEEIPVKKVRVTKHPFNTWWPGHQRPLDQTEFASYANFSISGKVTVTIKSINKPINKVDIRPCALGIIPEIQGNTITFTIDKPCHFTVEINDWHGCLHVFASKPEEYAVDINDQNVIYFGPGIHKAGLITLKSNQTLYLHESAVVYGTIYANEAENIKVLGRGVIDSSIYKRGTEYKGDLSESEEVLLALKEMNENRGVGNVLMRFCKNVVIDGVIFRDPPEWSFNIYNCQNVVINDVKLIGLWRYNADGIDIWLGKDFVISNSFIRSFDDSIVARGTCGEKDEDVFENMYVHNCVLWCEWGRAIEVWTSAYPSHINKLLFKDCYIIRTCHVAMDLQIYDSGPTYMNDIVCENIYVETDLHADRPIYQKFDDQVYMNTDENYMPELIFIGNAYKFKKPKNRIGLDADVHFENITFKNIHVYGNRMPNSLIKTIDGYMWVKNIVIDGIYFNENKLTTIEEINLIEAPEDLSEITIK